MHIYIYIDIVLHVESFLHQVSSFNSSTLNQSCHVESSRSRHFTMAVNALGRSSLWPLAISLLPEMRLRVPQCKKSHEFAEDFAEFSEGIQPLR